MSGFLLRWLVAFIVMAGIYNPTKYNYIAWAQENYETRQALVIALGVMLGIVALVFLIGTIRTMGTFGIILLLIILGLLGYILQDNGLITLEVNNLNIWGGLAILSFILAGAMSWRSFSRASARAAKAASKEAKA